MGTKLTTLLTPIVVGGNPFDQDLNTTDSPTFVDLTLGSTASLTLGTTNLIDLISLEVVFDGSTSRTLSLNDNIKHIVFSSVAAIDLTIPEDISVNFPVGAYIEFFQRGDEITYIPDTNVTILSRNGLTHSGGQFTLQAVKYLGSNDWELFGDLS